LNIRCSSLPLAMLCPASLAPPAIRIESDDEPARIGPDTGGNPDTIAAEFRLDERAQGEAEMLYACGMKMWRQMQEHFPNARVEQYASYEKNGLTLTGHRDVMAYGRDGQPRVGDFKTGRVDADHDNQIRGYCWLTLQEYAPELSDRCYGVVMDVRDQEIDGRWYTREELDTWHAGLVAKVQDDLETYNPGPHCSHCPRFHECPAWEQKLKLYLRVLDIYGSAVSHKEIGELFDAAKAVEKIVKEALGFVRGAAVEAGGVLPLPNGRELRIETQESKVIKFSNGINLLARLGLLTEDVRNAIKIPKGAVCDAAKAGVPKGLGAAAIRELMDALEAADALETETKEVMSARKAR
jgi:Protein of unknown function (DUF2800)